MGGKHVEKKNKARGRRAEGENNKPPDVVPDHAEDKNEAGEGDNKKKNDKHGKTPKRNKKQTEKPAAAPTALDSAVGADADDNDKSSEDEREENATHGAGREKLINAP